MFNFELTKFPKIFKKIYWGRFQNDTDNCSHERDGFIKGHNIKQVFDGAYPLPLCLDHTEIYNCHDGSLIMIYSPYALNTELIAFNDTHDFRPMKQTLYAAGVTTYIKTFINLKAFRAWERLVCCKNRSLLGW